uniref:Uncharacterized protein n=1 Tax=Panagrolaimus sp. JU765 TaxID=591449 RepID=A0AC34QCJ6_9BILA
MIRPAGSPTVTLLRLLPGSYQYNQTSSAYIITNKFETIYTSNAATGGVYKRQGRNQRMVVTYTYLKFLVHMDNYNP